MTARRLAAAICAIALALGYGACNRIIDLTPIANMGPDAGFPTPDAALEGDDSSLPPDAFTAGSDGPDASFPDAAPDAI